MAEMTTHDFIKQRIKLAFHDLAEEIATKADLTEEELLGVPMAIFRAETYMLGSWDRYVRLQKKKNARDKKEG